MDCGYRRGRVRRLQVRAQGANNHGAAKKRDIPGNPNSLREPAVTHQQSVHLLEKGLRHLLLKFEFLQTKAGHSDRRAGRMMGFHSDRCLVSRGSEAVEAADGVWSPNATCNVAEQHNICKGLTATVGAGAASFGVGCRRCVRKLKLALQHNLLERMTF